MVISDSLAWVLEVLHVQPALVAGYLPLVSPYRYGDTVVKMERANIP